METLFLKVLNMSLTGSYVILAVLIIRFLLKRAPRKYAYLLWPVVLFRLACPVSFSSLFSLFKVRPFDMTLARSGGGAALDYIPRNVGLMDTPEITVGIPAMNAMINPVLPQAAPAAGVNPLQIWITAGMVLWLAGIAVLLVYALTGYIRIKRRVSAAVRLEDGVFQDEKVRSPFILGLFRPVIYIPFGLKDPELRYVLLHERTHIRRGDHWIRPLSYLALAVHWFNPLVWLAHILMIRDMEMSCDENVLARTGGNGIHEYGASLLSFAANRRLPAAAPPAFCETGIRTRIRNILRFRPAKKWVPIVSTALCLLTVAACAANPLLTAVPAPSSSLIPSAPGEVIAEDSIYGNYKYSGLVYMTSLSSYLVPDDYVEYYTLSPGSVTLISAYGEHQSVTGSWHTSDFDEAEFKAGFLEDGSLPDISSYSPSSVLTFVADSGHEKYRLYRMGGELWLARMTQIVPDRQTEAAYGIWSIYRVVPWEGELNPVSMLWGYQTDVEEFLERLGDYDSHYEDDACWNITPALVERTSEYRIFKFDKSCESFLLFDGTIYPLGTGFGGYGVTSLLSQDLNGDGLMELYFTYSWGSGIHRSHAAYFDPVARETVELDAIRMDGDMIFLLDHQNTLCLYSADTENIVIEDFCHMTLTAGEILRRPAYADGRILLINP